MIDQKSTIYACYMKTQFYNAHIEALRALALLTSAESFWRQRARTFQERS